MDYNYVTKRLATGAAIGTTADVDLLVQAGITHIIDCRGEFDDASFLLSHPNIVYVWNGTADDGQPKSPEWFDGGLKVALPAFAQPHAKVYAHCAAGINRGPSMCYAILRALGFEAALAEATIRAARPQVGIAYKSDADKAITALGYE